MQTLRLIQRLASNPYEGCQARQVGWLVHSFGWVEIGALAWSVSSSFLLTGFFPAVIVLSVLELFRSQHHLINAIKVEKERGAWPNLTRRS